VAARVAHNHKVVGSSPAPATKKRVPVYLGLFSWLLGSDTARRRRFALANMQVVGSDAKKLPAEARLRCQLLRKPACPAPATK
jgi:hypothetical protein